MLKVVRGFTQLTRKVPRLSIGFYEVILGVHVLQKILAILHICNGFKVQPRLQLPRT